MLPNTKPLAKIIAISAIAILGACSDSTVPVAPVSPQTTFETPLPSVVMSQATVAEQVETVQAAVHGTSAVVYPSNAVTYQFTYATEKSQSFIIGLHMVKFPANTVCDPALSSYGPGTWLTPCTKSKLNLTITAVTWTDAHGRPQIDFHNALRFTASKEGSLPSIYLRDPTAALSSWSRIDYCGPNGVCVDEAATDPTLVTKREVSTGFLYRLIRHFSGYNVWA